VLNFSCREVVFLPFCAAIMPYQIENLNKATAGGYHF
jgi:hypothetical protein